MSPREPPRRGSLPPPPPSPRALARWRARAHVLWQDAKPRLLRMQRWTLRNIPPGLRLLLGLLLIAGGLVGFLPVLGFWMIPLGVAIAVLDVRALRRWVRRRRMARRARERAGASARDADDPDR